MILYNILQGKSPLLWHYPEHPNGNHITQKELAEKIGVSASQLSRTVSSDILIRGLVTGLVTGTVDVQVFNIFLHLLILITISDIFITVTVIRRCKPCGTMRKVVRLQK